MTVVVGIRGKKGVLLAGDSQFSTPWTNRKMRTPKVFQLSDVVAIAYCGSARLGQVLMYHLNELEAPGLGEDEHRWAVREFIPYVREVMHVHGVLEVHHNVEALTGYSAFLLAVRGRLFTVDDDFQVSEGYLAYEALGTGADVAIGALHGTLGEETTPLNDQRLESLARSAVESATELTNYVGGDISFARTVLYTAEEKALARKILR